MAPARSLRLFRALLFELSLRSILTFSGVVTFEELGDVIVQYPGFPYRDSIPDGTQAQARRLIHECR